MLLQLSRAIGRGHRVAAQEHLDNRPPVLTVPVADVSIPAGQLSTLELNPDTFVDLDVGDALRYRAYASHTDRLPHWIKFDGLNRRFDFHPPHTDRGRLNIRIVARDYDGLESDSSFTLTWGP
jgi:hypothetical protein